VNCKDEQGRPCCRKRNSDGTYKLVLMEDVYKSLRQSKEEEDDCKRTNGMKTRSQTKKEKVK